MLFSIAEKRRNDDDSADPAIVDQAITSARFWGYLRMAGVIARMLDRFLHWVEACPCHKSNLNGFPNPARDGYSKAARKRYFERRYGVKRCPLSGCRAADMALGRWRDVVQRIFATAATDLDVAIPADVSSDDRAAIIHDFVLSRSHLEFTFDLKFLAWDHLPMKICGISDVDQNLARRCGAQCIVLWHNCAHRDLLHPLARTLLRDGTLRSQLIRFVRGDDISSPTLARLRHYLGQFVLIITCERAVEAMHARLCSPPTKFVDPNGRFCVHESGWGHLYAAQCEAQRVIP